MPPTRTTVPAKPVKTERTHEENQERAYIAASRRSDRSLEARVESARRASEIHKRRTGRGLKVTEQDVINEEMYEEEDDDLPMAYRRLTAHIQSNHPEFNRRLSAYLTANVAMRSALEQSIQTSYQQSYAGPPPTFPAGSQQQLPNINTQWDMFQSPMYAHQQQQQQRSNVMPSSPSYRQAPYPIPNQNSQGFQTAHQRSQSFANPQNFSASSTQSPILSSPNTLRRVSLPVNATASPEASTPDSGTSRTSRPKFPHGSFNTPSQNLLNDANRLKEETQASAKTESQEKTEPNFGANMTASNNDMWPLTTNLPPNMQAFMPGSFGFPNDPLTDNLMMGSQMNNSPYDSSANFGQTNPSLAGLTSTLAGPGMGDDPEANSNANYFNDAFVGTKGISGTPGDETWNQFMDDSAWDVLPSSQTSQ